MEMSLSTTLKLVITTSLPLSIFIVLHMAICLSLLMRCMALNSMTMTLSSVEELRQDFHLLNSAASHFPTL